MIQPSFTFLVGVALPYSLASRERKGKSFASQFAHTLWRSLILVALGIFLRSTHSSQTNFTFEDTLTQIGLGYTVAFLLARCQPRWQWTAFTTLLVGYWLAWALYPAPSPTFDYAAVGVPAELASQFHRIRLALEQKQQSGPGLRSLVPQSAPRVLLASHSMAADISR